MSRDKKRQIIFYQVDDSEAISRHLSKMARKGWLLESVDNWYYIYRRGDPVEIKYAVTFFPEASCFDPGLLEGQETYAEYCEAAGWELAASYGPVQYFRTTNPDPLPIETDETMKLAAIRKTMRKTFVLSYALLLLIPAVGLPLCRMEFQHDPLAFLCGSRYLANLLIQSGIVLFSAGMLIDYLIWLLRSGHAVAQGGCCKKPHTRFRLGLTVFILTVCVASIALFLADNSRLSAIFLIYLALYAGLMLLSRLVLRKLKASSGSRSVIRTAFLGFAVAGGLALGFGSPFLFIKLADARVIHMEREPAETYTYISSKTSFRYSRGVYYDDLPITLEELGYTVTERDHCSYEEKTERTVLASHSRYTQEALNLDSALPDLTCQTYDIRWSWLLQSAWEECIAKETGQLDRWPLEKLDPAPWDAAEAYRRAGMTTYFLLYPSRIVVFHLGDDAAPQQLALIVQALRP